MTPVPPQPAAGVIRTAMDRAVVLARRGPVRDPNPRVGCVLLAPDGDVVGEGFHAGAGTPHAEVGALATAGEAARGSTAVVTLEPCDHVGRTGPCSLALLDAGVVAVRYAVPDPTTTAAGGATRLRRAGVDVELVRHEEAEALLADWVRALALGRPHVTWKIASTLDGRVAAADGTSRWITSSQARSAAHLLRQRVDAVVVGTGTAAVDDPALTARDPDGAPSRAQPLRVVVGRRDLVPGSRLLSVPAPEPPLHLRTHDPQAVVRALHDRGVRTALLEGGPTLAGAFWREGLVDEVLIHLAPALLGSGPGAVPDLGVTTIADAARLELLEVTRLGPDLQLRLRPGSVPPLTHPLPVL